MAAVTSTGRHYEQQNGAFDFFIDKVLRNENIPLYLKIPSGISCLVCFIFVTWILITSDKSTF